jgi:hypothetical protein
MMEGREKKRFLCEWRNRINNDMFFVKIIPQKKTMRGRSFNIVLGWKVLS